VDVISSVHVTDQLGHAWENAARISTQMVYGDGGRLFRAGSLTSAVDVIGHELTHGVTQFTAALEYRSQSGALNECFSDVVGSMIKTSARLAISAWSRSNDLDHRSPSTPSKYPFTARIGARVCPTSN
jgi:Zn-dependent metalloprotease